MAKTKKNNDNAEFDVQNAIDEIVGKTDIILTHYQSVDKRKDLGRQIKNLDTNLKKLQESCTADSTMMCSLRLNESLVEVKARIQKEVNEMTETIKRNSSTIFSKMSMNRALKDKKNFVNLADKIMEDNVKLQNLLIICSEDAVRNGNKCTNKN